MRRGVHSQRQARHDGEAALGQRAGEGAGVVGALGGRVAAADDGERRFREPIAPALQPQQQRRVGGGEQARRVVRVDQHQQVAARLSQPGLGLVEQCAQMGRRLVEGIALPAG